MEPLIIFENDELLVLNKPAGLLVHPIFAKATEDKRDSNSSDKTLADWILEHYPALKRVGEEQLDTRGEPIMRPGIVHRLDRDTSGVLVVAKTQEAFLYLKEQFKNRTIQKTYCALVYGVVQKEEGSITAPIGRSRVNGKWTAVRPGDKTREALTEYCVRERFDGYTVLTVTPRTGRTHQIRVHLKSIGHSVVCDSVYAPKQLCPVCGLGRLALHAESLQLTLPSGEDKNFTTPLPKDFTEALEALRNV